MPQAALAEVEPDAVGPVADLAKRIGDWLAQVPPRTPAGRRAQGASGELGHGDLTPFTCPDCGGTLWLHSENGTHRFRCRVGHSFSADSLLLGKQDALEAALWAAVVALDERADLARRIAKRLEQTGSSKTRRYQREAEDAQRRSAFLRDSIHDLIHTSSGSEQ
jgi:hypothetical protein